MISPNDDVTRSWRINEQKWKDCRENDQAEIFCGFLKIHRNQDAYVLKVTRENNKWQVTVVKKTGTQVSYYNNTQQKWVDKAATNIFDQLRGWEQESRTRNNNSGWEDEFNQPSIVKNN